MSVYARHYTFSTILLCEKLYNICLKFYYSYIKVEGLYFVIPTSFRIIGFKNLDIDELISYPGFSGAEWNR